MVEQQGKSNSVSIRAQVRPRGFEMVDVEELIGHPLVERLELFNELSDMADALERFELRVAAMVASWTKGRPVKPEELGIGITYHREYALESLSDAADTLGKAMRAVGSVSPAAVKALLIGFIQRALPQGSPYLNEAIAQVDQASRVQSCE